MTLPASPNTVYVATITQVKAADLNDLQDLIVSLYKAVDISPAIGFRSEDGSAAAAAHIPDGGGSVASQSAGASEWSIPIEFPVGTIINAIHVRTLEANLAGETFTLKLLEFSDGALNQLGDTITSGVTDALVTQTWDDTTNDTPGEIPHTLTTGARLVVLVEFLQTSLLGEARVHNVQVEPSA